MFAPFGDLPSEGGFLYVEECGDVGVVHVEEVSHEYGFNGLLVELFSSVKDGDAGTGDDGWGGFLDMDYADIAALLDVKESTLRWQVAEGRKHLRRLLSPAT